jgi:hypothetical protein
VSACSWDLEGGNQHSHSLERLLKSAAKLELEGKSEKETELLLLVNIEDNFSVGKDIDVSYYFCRRF